MGRVVLVVIVVIDGPSDSQQDGDHDDRGYGVCDGSPGSWTGE